MRTGGLPLARERRDRLRHERVEAAGDVGRDERVETAGGVEDRDAAIDAAAAQDGAFDAEPDVAAVARDDAAVAGAVAARHRRLVRELRAGHEHRQRVEHRLRPAGEHVAGLGRERVGDKRRVEDDRRVRDERRCLGVCVRAEAEDRGRRAEALREVRKRRDADAAADEERPLDVEVEARPSGPVTWICSPDLERRDRACARARSARRGSRARPAGASTG